MANKVIHKRSIQKGLLPSGTTLDYGEIAVNYNSGEPFLSIRTTESGKTNTDYVKFIDEAAIDAKIKNVENQNAFSKVAVSGKTTIEADSATDTLTFAAGSNISITTDASNDKITIAATGLSASGHNHDDRYLKNHQTIYDLTLSAGTFSAATFDPNGAAKTVYIPTHTSHLTNNSGFVTNDSNLAWGTTAINGGISPVDAALSNIHSANRLAFGNASGITIEYSQNAGSSWTTYSTTDVAKINLVSGIGSEYSIGGRNSTANTVNDQLRVTLNASDMGIYTQPRKLLLNISTNYAKGSKVKVEYATKGAPTTFTTLGTYDISGWSGWNSIPLGTLGTFGGGSTQTSNKGVIRMTFSITGVTSGQSNGLSLLDVALHGDTYWTTPSALAKTGHLYTYDANKNAVFPGVVTATTFKKPDGTEVSYTDSKVTSVDNHYTPTATTAHTISKDASSTTKATWGSTSLVTGVNIERDAKGHVINVTLDSIQMPSNPDSHYTTHMYLGSSTATADATSDVANPYIRLFDNTTAREDIQVVGQNNLTVKGKNGIITIDGSHNHDGTYLKSYTETYQGTLTGITVTGASGLTGTGTISKTSGKTGGTITLGHATKTVSTTTPTGTTNLSHEGTFVIPTIGYDSYGHVSGITNTTYKLPSDNNTWRPVYNGVDSTSTESGATANAVKTAYDLAKSKWTYSADTIKAVKVNSAAAADKVSSAITLTYGSTAGKTGSTTYSGNSKPTVYIPTSTSHITNDSGYITSAHTHAASAITGGTNGYFLKADSNGKGVWTSVTIPSAYSLPTASSSVKGGVKVGNFLAMSGETLYVKTGTTNATVAVGNHTHSTYATKDEITAINQTIEENELVTAEALININDRITNIVNTESSSEKAYLTGLAESGEGEIVMNNDVYMANGNIYVQDGKIVATQEYLDENLETLAAAAVDLNNRLNNGAPVKVEKSENVRAELGGFVVRNWNNEVPEIHTSHYVSSGVYMEQNSVYTVNGFYQTSDERKKNFENEIEVDFNKLKEIPKSYFTWKDDEKQVRNIGTSAQKLAEIYPELVSYNETDDEYSVSYAELSIVALKAVDKLYEENQMLREELAMIKKHLGL